MMPPSLSLSRAIRDFASRRSAAPVPSAFDAGQAMAGALQAELRADSRSQGVYLGAGDKARRISRRRLA